MAHPEALPHNYQEKAKQDSLPRVVCDYIAGMTDNFIFEQYEKHCGAMTEFDSSFPINSSAECVT